MADPEHEYRSYDTTTRTSVRELYALNHTHQTYAFAQAKRAEFGRLDRGSMTVLDALDFVNSVYDESDPDLELDQRQHALQTAEALRADGAEEWMVLVGLIHDLGKVLCSYGEPQWAVVGDTFPLGCAFRNSIVHAELFAENPDRDDPRFASPTGIYSAGVGLRNVTFSWGHDEYLYQVLKRRLPEPALYVIRFHSFYAWHGVGDYDDLCDDHDREHLPYVRDFSRYDLYSKSPEPADWGELEPYYADLCTRWLPGALQF